MGRVQRPEAVISWSVCGRRGRLAVLASVAALTAGCGADGEDDRRETAPPGPGAAQPYPPRAAEPARAPRPSAEPAGRVVRVGGPAEGMVVDPASGTLAAALLREPRLALVDAGSGAPGRRVDLPASPRHLELAGPGGPVLVPAEEADALVAVDPRTGATTTTEVGDHPHDAAFLDGRAYTVDEFGSTLTEVRGERTGRSVPVDVQPGGVVAVGDQLGVVSVRAYTFELFDPRTLRGGGSQSAGLGPTHVVADAEGNAYITDTRGDALIVFATRPRLKFLARVPLAGGPYGIALDEERDRLWVALSGRNELVELSTGAKPRRVRSLPTVRQPNSVAVDPRNGRVFVASAADDALQLVDP
jgi:DNA-binding beta-propeller fold protein YncE